MKSAVRMLGVWRDDLGDLPGFRGLCALASALTRGIWVGSLDKNATTPKTDLIGDSYVLGIRTARLLEKSESLEERLLDGKDIYI